MPEQVLILIKRAPTKLRIWTLCPLGLFRNLLWFLHLSLHMFSLLVLKEVIFLLRRKRRLFIRVLRNHRLTLMIYLYYRSISNLSFVSKLLERAVHDQLLLYLNDNELLPSFQDSLVGGMNDKKLEPSLHWGEEFEEGVSPSSLLGVVWGGLSPPQKTFAFFTSKSRILSHIYCVIPELLDSDRLNSLYITWLRLKIYWSLKFVEIYWSLKFVDIFTCFFLIQILLAKGWYTIANFSHNWAIYKNGPPGRYFIKSTVAQMGHNFKKKF